MFDLDGTLVDGVPDLHAGLITENSRGGKSPPPRNKAREDRPFAPHRDLVGNVMASPYSTVTDFARLRGWSASLPMMTAVW